jgi:hypothetical protein
MEFKSTSNFKQSHRRHGNVLVDYTMRGKDVTSKRCVDLKFSRETSQPLKTSWPSEGRRNLQFEKSFSTIVSSDYLSDVGVLGDNLVDFYLKIPSREYRRGKRDDSVSDLTRHTHSKGRKMKKKSIIRSVLELS